MHKSAKKKKELVYRYVDGKAEERIEALGDEFEVLSDGIKHILKLSSLEQDRSR